MKKLFFFLFIISFVLTGCLGRISTKTKQPLTDDQAGLPNPAAVYCLDQGGTLEQIERDGGMDADCVFPDNTRCPQWNFFRNDCQPGETSDCDGFLCATAPCGPLPDGGNTCLDPGPPTECYQLCKTDNDCPQGKLCTEIECLSGDAIEFEMGCK